VLGSAGGFDEYARHIFRPASPVKAGDPVFRDVNGRAGKRCEAKTPVWKWRDAGHRQLIARRMGAAAIPEYPSHSERSSENIGMEETP